MPAYSPMRSMLRVVCVTLVWLLVSAGIQEMPMMDWAVVAVAAAVVAMVLRLQLSETGLPELLTRCYAKPLA